MKIFIKFICILLVSVLICVSFTGCWNYRRLNRLTIVAGIAIDRPENGGDSFKVSFETIDFSQSLKDNTISTKIIDSDGITIFDAFNKTKNKAIDDLYFANMQLICLSEQIVKEEGLIDIIDGFMRDADIRESVCIIISRDESAGKIITPSGDESKIMSYDINNVVDGSSDSTNTARKIGVYKAYNQVKDSECFVLPAFSISEEKPVLNGMALFRGDEMLGFVDQKYTEFYQFASDSVRTGIFSFPLYQDGDYDCSVKISNNKTKISFDKKEDGNLIFTIDIKTEAAVKEIMENFDILKEENRDYFKQKYSEYVSGNVYDFIDMVRREYSADILNFESLVYRSGESTDGWQSMFMNAEIRVKTELELTSSGFIN